MYLSIDYETELISKESPIPQPVCLSSFNGFDKKLHVGEEILSFLGKALDHTIIAHNAIFECLVTYQYYPPLREKLFKALSEGRIVCTMINQDILNSRIKNQVYDKSLAGLVKYYFKEDISEGKKDPDAWRLRYGELKDIPKDQWPEEAVDYAIMDSVWAYKLNQEIKVDKKHYKRPVEASFYLNLMGKQGLRVDPSRVDVIEKEVSAIITPKYTQLESLGFVVKSKGKYKKKSKELREYVERTVAEPIHTMKGAVKTGKEALLKYYEKNQDPIFEDFLKLNEYEKVVTAFTPRLKNQELIYTDYSTTKSTGRTSSFSSRLYPSVNIQQMPRSVPNLTYDVRNCFIPREGFKIISIDYNGLELASAANQLYKTFGYSNMRDLLNDGDVPIDLHSLLAAKIMSLKGNLEVSYESFIEHKGEPEYKKMRQMCKEIGLGLPGGRGLTSIRTSLVKMGIITKYEVLVTHEDHRKLIPILLNAKNTEPNLRLDRISQTKWAIVYDELVSFKSDIFKVYPDLARFLNYEHKKHMTGYQKMITNDFGVRELEPMYAYKVGDWERDWCTYTAFCNGYLMQTPSAIGATNAMIELNKKYLNHPDVRLLAFIHDEVLAEVRGDIDLHKRDMSTIMLNEMAKPLPHVRLAVGASVMDYWMKEADNETIFFKNPREKEIRRLK